MSVVEPSLQGVEVWRSVPEGPEVVVALVAPFHQSPERLYRIGGDLVPDVLVGDVVGVVVLERDALVEHGDGQELIDIPNCVTRGRLFWAMRYSS